MKNLQQAEMVLAHGVPYERVREAVRRFISWYHETNGESASVMPPAGTTFLGIPVNSTGLPPQLFEALLAVCENPYFAGDVEYEEDKDICMRHHILSVRGRHQQLVIRVPYEAHLSPLSLFADTYEDKPEGYPYAVATNTPPWQPMGGLSLHAYAKYAFNAIIDTLLTDADVTTSKQGTHEEESDMALQIKGIDGWLILRNAGIDAQLLDLMKKHDVAITIQPSKLVLTAPGPYVCAIALSLERMKQLHAAPGDSAMQGWLFQFRIDARNACHKLLATVGAPATFVGKVDSVYAGKIKAAINTAHKAAHNFTTQGEAAEAAMNALGPLILSEAKGAGLAHLVTSLNKHGCKVSSVDLGSGDHTVFNAYTSGPGPAPPAPVVVVGGKWEYCTVEEMVSADLTPLRDASKMYQPVKGSTAGKRYYCIALSATLRAGVAYDGSELSVRIEGPNFVDHFDAIKVMFITAIKAKGYGSLHFGVTDTAQAARALGAILMGVATATNAPWETPLPVLEFVKGK